MSELEELKLLSLEILKRLEKIENILKPTPTNKEPSKHIGRGLRANRLGLSVSKPTLDRGQVKPGQYAR